MISFSCEVAAETTILLLLDRGLALGLLPALLALEKVLVQEVELQSFIELEHIGRPDFARLPMNLLQSCHFLLELARPRGPPEFKVSAVQGQIAELQLLAEMLEWVQAGELDASAQLALTDAAQVVQAEVVGHLGEFHPRIEAEVHGNHHCANHQIVYEYVERYYAPPLVAEVNAVGLLETSGEQTAEVGTPKREQLPVRPHAVLSSHFQTAVAPPLVSPVKQEG
jgi:hypothetical protein